MKGLADNHYLVTGGASGIGRGCAERLIEAGARVSVVDLDSERAVKLADRLGAGRAIAFGCDVTREEQVIETLATAQTQLGPLSGMVTSAGVNLEADRLDLAEVEAAAFEQVLRVNLLGTFLFAKHLLPQLATAGAGSVVLVSSTAGIRGGHGQGFGYTASKGGVVALTEQLASIYGKAGVRINCLAPGATAGEGMGSFFEQPGADALVAPQVPLGRVGRCEEVGAVAAWLLSGEASYVTGQTVAADGGATAR